MTDNTKSNLGKDDDLIPIIGSDEQENVAYIANSIQDIEEQSETLTNTDMESEAKRRQRLRSLRILNVVNFTFALSFSIVLTGAFPYLKELMPEETEDAILTKYGLVVSTLPVAQLICSPIFGKVADRIHSIRPLCLIMAIIFTCSSVLYATLSDVSSNPQTRFYLMMLSRFCAGAFSANLGPIRGYISQTTLDSERTKELTISIACQSLGFTLGPIFQAVFGELGCSDLAASSSRYFGFESYNVCGWVTAALGALNIFLFILFDEQKEIRGQDNATQPTAGAPLPRVDYLGLFICLLCLSIYYFNFVFLEALGAPMCMEQFGWTQEHTVTYFGILIGSNGILSIAYYISINKLSKRGVDERKLLIGVGLVAQIIGRLIFLPLPNSPLPPLIPISSNRSIRLIENKLYWQNMFENSSNVNPNGFGTSESKYSHSNQLAQNAINTFHLSEDAHKNRELHYYSQSITNFIGNVQCEEVSGPPGCNLDWCSYTPSLSVPQFIVGWMITSVGYSFSVPLTLTIATKMYGPRRQGLFMSMTVVFGAFSRFLGPFFVSYVYKTYGTYYAVGSSLLTLFCALVMISCNYRRMVPLTSQAA